MEEILIGFFSFLEYVVELPVLDVHIHGVFPGIFLIHYGTRAKLKETRTLFIAFIECFHVCVLHLSIVFQDSRHRVQKLDSFIWCLQVKRFVHEVDL